MKSELMRVLLSGMASWLLVTGADAFGDPESLLRQGKAAELMGRSIEARKAWRDFLIAEAQGDRAEQVRNRLLVLESKDLGKDCRAYPVWSPDGRMIMCGYGTMSMVDVATGDGFPLEAPRGPMYFHDWAADGVTIACRQKLDDGRPAVFLYERQPDEALYPAGDGESVCQGIGGRFDWTGKQLLVSHAARMVEGKLKQYEIGLYDLASGTLVRVPWRNAQRPGRSHASWAGPDRYVFHAYGGAAMGDRAIFAATLKGDGVIQITENGAENRTPAVAPDGLRVAYGCAREGGPETLYLARTDGAMKPIEIGPGMQPCWSPDGSWLAYETGKGIRLLRFGGVSACPVAALGAAKGEALTITLLNDSQVPQTVRLSCQIYDERSVRLADWSWDEDAVTLPPGESLANDYPLPEEIRGRANLARFRVQPVTGAAEVLLVDLGPKGAGQ